MCVVYSERDVLCPRRADGGSGASNRGSQVTGEYATCHSFCLSDSSLIKGQLRAGNQPGSLRAMSIISHPPPQNTHNLQKAFL